MCLQGKVLAAEGDLFTRFKAGEELDLLSITENAGARALAEGHNLIVECEDGKLYHARVGVIVEEIEPEAAVDVVAGLTIDRCRICRKVLTRAEGEDIKKLTDHVLAHKAWHTDGAVEDQFEKLA